ncbi:hypothetical protein AXG93_2727s1320 [Marchantia polymorpha subsp. ruderalis]|uniref:Uncharacterized protein n=1 Tax=Marchantia polymorpha subsp. ruderalis TaxID=1480154 RepID=A0A176VEZ3_MARPO|nr:hypothetical protein AXG93_2727s1320 [Marchantia polymorpha subsp. ruderalis]
MVSKEETGAAMPHVRPGDEVTGRVWRLERLRSVEERQETPARKMFRHVKILTTFQRPEDMPLDQSKPIDGKILELRGGVRSKMGGKILIRGKVSWLKNLKTWQSRSCRLALPLAQSVGRTRHLRRRSERERERAEQEKGARYERERRERRERERERERERADRASNERYQGRRGGALKGRKWKERKPRARKPETRSTGRRAGGGDSGKHQGSRGESVAGENDRPTERPEGRSCSRWSNERAETRRVEVDALLRLDEASRSSSSKQH